MLAFVRVNSTLINLAAVRSVGFEVFAGNRCVVLRYTDGNIRFTLRSPEGAQVCEGVLPHYSIEEIEAEFFGDDDPEAGPVATSPGGGPRGSGSLAVTESGR